MLKRLIEVSLPLEAISDESAYDNRVRSSHIRTIHIWWARRPLAACRGVIFASLIPDADDPECPESFRSLVKELLSESQYKPKNSDGSAVEDTPRNRCLEYIKHLVKWDNSSNSHYIEPARKLIAAAHSIYYTQSDGSLPRVLDLFAGGGAIPLEALRLGCEAHAVDLNPVAHLIELCTLVYPQRYGQPNSRSVPPYIKRLIAHRKAKKRAKGQEAAELFPEADAPIGSDEIIPEVEITEAEYLSNPLAADVKYWGGVVFSQGCSRLGGYYLDSKNDEQPLAFLWARTIRCPNPACGATYPLLRQLWLCNKAKRKFALFPQFEAPGKPIEYAIKKGPTFSFDPSKGTMGDGKACCPYCETVADGEYLRAESAAGRMGRTMTAVVIAEGPKGKAYRIAGTGDVGRSGEAASAFKGIAAKMPAEPLPKDRPSPNSRGLSAIVRYGLSTFGEMFSPRQGLSLVTFSDLVNEVRSRISASTKDEDYASAIAAYLGFALDKVADFSTEFCRWGNDDEGVTGTFGRQAVGMVWDYAETNPLTNRTGGFAWAVTFVADVIRHCSQASKQSVAVQNASASRLPFEASTLSAIITDPPYYDSVPYGDLSDFFYVWLKRSVGRSYPHLFRTPLTPKREEIIAYWSNSDSGRAVQKPPEWYEDNIGKAFAEASRVLADGGIVAVMFAHKTTTAWETIIQALGRARLYCTASWPIHTEGRGRLTSHDAAALASSITIVCRKREEKADDGFWDDVRVQLRDLLRERLDFFWSQGIRGADFFISAIGPALSVFGKYEKVTKLTGEEVAVDQFLDEVRSLVTTYALNKIMKTTHTAGIDAESLFYVIWKWSYGDAKVPADESFKLAQALRMDTEIMWDRTGILEKSGENVQAVPIAKRMKIKDLGEPNADTTPASLIDVLHRLCVFRDKGDSQTMAEFLGRSGQGRNSNLWLMAQAISETLPDGDKEKQLMQGLLNQRDQLEKAGEQLKLF